MLIKGKKHIRPLRVRVSARSLNAGNVFLELFPCCLVEHAHKNQEQMHTKPIVKWRIRGRVGSNSLMR